MEQYHLIHENRAGNVSIEVEHLSSYKAMQGNEEKAERSP